ncbi:hypothetical protein DFR86_02640 [Acidianus sulfidivorans JP7]|uniref:Uncharacterized protein n=1 Tax=Acidianus sulfidivorans JP7 TaxID=619593 RepID=A0A2U9IKL1_9CREN|nr:hypothetical protein [Acidianus sulfidivorans]AWR96553.1 hypothetical protein DFR86_02640 [Acidianus sulfidivorans JP7]
MDFKSVIAAITKRGTNVNAIANFLKEPSSKVKEILKTLFRKYSLSIFTVINSEGLGLNKIALICKDSNIKIENEKKLFIPLLNLFRSDFEENKFINILYYTDKLSLNSIYNAVEFLKSKNIVNCEIKEITEVRRYYRDIECFDFKTKKWLCTDKIEIKHKFDSITPDHEDIKLITMTQVNPSIPYYYHPHYNHVKKVLEGFSYILGKKDFIIDVMSDQDISDKLADILWVAKTRDEYYISELHVNYNDLENTMNVIKKFNSEIILAPHSPYYAEGFTIPFEIFREKKWEFPKILIE